MKEFGGDMYKRVVDNRLYIVAKNDVGIETNCKEYIHIYALNPRLNSIFIADMVFQLSILPKSKRAAFKKTVCEVFEINPETLKSALWRYSHSLNSNLGIAKADYSKPGLHMELDDDIGTLDDDHWTKDIKTMANNLKTVPSINREEKYRNAIELIHNKYGKDELYENYYKNLVNFINEKVA